MKDDKKKKKISIHPARCIPLMSNAAYIKGENGILICPVCNGNNIRGDGGPATTDTEVVSYDVTRKQTCIDCGAEWNELLSVIGYRLIKPIEA